MAGTTLETDGKPFTRENGELTEKTVNWLNAVIAHMIELFKSGREGELQLRADPFAGIGDCKVRYFEPQDDTETGPRQYRSALNPEGRDDVLDYLQREGQEFDATPERPVQEGADCCQSCKLVLSQNARLSLERDRLWRLLSDTAEPYTDGRPIPPVLAEEACGARAMLRLDITETPSAAGLFFATSPDIRGLLVAETSLDELWRAIPGAISDLRAAAGAPFDLASDAGLEPRSPLDAADSLGADGIEIHHPVKCTGPMRIQADLSRDVWDMSASASVDAGAEMASDVVEAELLARVAPALHRSGDLSGAWRGSQAVEAGGRFPAVDISEAVND